MHYSIIVSLQADADLDDIVAYISRTLNNPSAARRFIDNLQKKFLLLQSQPRLFPFSRNSVLAAKGYRIFAVGNYLAFYQADETEEVVRIARILYAHRDLESLL